MRGRTERTTAAGLAIMALTGCVNSSPETGDSSGADSVAEYSLAEQLQHLPRVDETGVILATDYTRVEELTGAPRPSLESSPEEFDEWRQELSDSAIEPQHAPLGYDAGTD